MRKSLKSIYMSFSAAILLVGINSHAALAAFAVGTSPSDGTYPSPGGSSSSGDQTLGGMIQNAIESTSTIPGAISGLCYLAGLIFGFLGVLKLKEHVESPNNVPIWDPVKRFLTGGGFFALPFVADVARNLVAGDDGGDSYSGGGFNGESSGSGLDAMIVALMQDIFLPAQYLFGWFGYLAGLVFVVIGISRLMKSEQDGPRGPAGFGTLMTFVIAGALFSLNSMIAFINASLFGDDSLKTNGVLAYTEGLAGASDHIHAVIGAIIAFSILIGWISLIRGFFIIRGVSEGNQQASMMAAVTHIIGGVLAVNLGGVINAVQKTLGITQYGITFS